MRTPAETTEEVVQADLTALSDESIVAVAGVVFIGLEELGLLAPFSLNAKTRLAAAMVQLVRLFAGVELREEGEAEGVEEGKGDNAGA